jgi:uncharacterized membrane protein
MATAIDYPMTHQGVRDLDHPIRPTRVNVGAGERTASSVGGALLAGFGLARGGLFGLALAAVGGALVYRGSTGHCLAYAALGMNTAR